MNPSRVSGLILAVALASAPALAQTTTNGNTTPGAASTPAVGTTTPGAAPGAPGTNPPGATAGMGADSSSHNPVLTADGEVRASQVIGSSVYNDKNEKIGSVDDILLGKDQKATQAVISVGGVLGVGAKLVAVPYDKLKFNDTVDSKTSRVMMPGEDSNALNGMPTFHYASK